MRLPFIGYAAILLPLLARAVLADYLNVPQFVNQWDTNEPILQGNGITGSQDGRIFVTTQSGNLWILDPLEQVEEDDEPTDPIVFAPTPWIDEATGDALEVLCLSSAVVKETEDEQVLYVVYVIMDLRDNGDVAQSRVFGVDPISGSQLWSVELTDSAAVGTPVLGQEYLYVVHNNIENDEGRLSLIQVTADNSRATIVDTYTSAPNTPWGPPSLASFPPEDDTWVEAVVWGDRLDNGLSEVGSTHLLKVGNDRPVLQTLSTTTGSSRTEPTLGQIVAQGNNQFSWKIVTGNYDGRFHVWGDGNNEVDWNQLLDSETTLDEPFDPTWSEVAPSPSTAGFTMQVSPVFSAAETFLFVAGAEGSISAWDIDQRRILWERPTARHVSQPILHVPSNLANNNPAVLYTCDELGVIRQFEANHRNRVNWIISYCDAVSQGPCPGVSANIFNSKNGNLVFVANEQGSIFALRVAAFETPAPTALDVSEPTSAPIAMPTAVPTRNPTDEVNGVQTGAPTESEQDGANGDQSDQGDDNGGDPPAGQPMVTSAPSLPPAFAPGTPSGAEARASESDSSSNGLYIMLGALTVALCFCVGGVAVFLKRRRRSKETREKEIRDEMAAVRRWKSSKKMYEQEMRDEEEATMQELSSGSPRRSLDVQELPKTTETNTTEKSATTTPPQKEKRSRSRSRGRAQSSTPGTLGSISESIDEEIGTPPDMEDGSGVEITIDELEGGKVARNLSVAFASDDEKKSQTNGSVKKGSPAEELLNETGPEKKDTKGGASEIASKSKSAAEQKEKVVEAISEADSAGGPGSIAKAARILETKSSSSTYTQDDDQSDTNSELSKTTEEPGRIKPYVPPPSTSPSDIHTALSNDDDNSDMTSLLSGLSARSYSTEEPGAIKASSKKIHYLPGSPVSSDLMSVDSSLYLDDNTAFTPAPPADPEPIDQPKSTPTPKTPPTRSLLGPPEGASVAGFSAGSPESTGKSGVSMVSGSDGTDPSVMMPPLSIASDETDKRSNSIEGPSKYSSTKVQPRSVPALPPKENHLYTKPVVAQSSSQTRRTKAGLFSRRNWEDKAASKNLSSNMSYSEWSESVSAASSTNEEMKIVGKAPTRGIDSRKVKPATDSFTRVNPTAAPTTENSKNKSSSSKPARGESKPEKTRQNDQQGDEDSPWSSFLTQLAKVEEEFFNPTMPQKASPKPKAQKAQRQYGRKRSGKPSFPPPLPPRSSPPPPPPPTESL